MPQLVDVIEQLGFGPAQLVQVVIGGGVYCADGAELLIIGAVTRTVSDEWHFSCTQRGSIVTCVFLGVMVGNMLGGWFGDAYGRKSPIVFSFGSVGFCSVLSATASGYASLAIFRICVGISFGIGVPAWNTLSGEIVPAKWRMMCNGLSTSMFILGEVYAGLLLLAFDPTLKKIDWRLLVILGSIPSFVLFISGLIRLYESPVQLEFKGQRRRALEILESIRCLNDRKDVDIQFEASSQFQDGSLALSEQVAVVFGMDLLLTTLSMSYSCLVLNFLYYGGLYVFPQIFAHELETSVSPAMNLIIGAVWEVPGLILAISVGTLCSRKPTMLLALCLNTVALVCFGWAGSEHSAQRSSVLELILHIAYYVGKLTNTLVFILYYVYISEVYPTMVRSMGSALCIAFGRLGAMIAPLVYEKLRVATGSFKSFFYVSAVLCALNMFCVYPLPETFGLKLQHRSSADPVRCVEIEMGAPAARSAG